MPMVGNKIVDPICMTCIRALGFDPKKCLAYPSGIPDEIWEGKEGHREPYKGDRGITYKSIFGDS